MNLNFTINKPMPVAKWAVDSDNQQGSSSEHPLMNLNGSPSFDHPMSDQFSRPQGGDVVTTDSQQPQTLIRVSPPEQCETSVKQQFHLQAQLIERRPIYIKVTPYFCDTCGINYNTQGRLVRHQNDSHANELLLAGTPIIASASKNLIHQVPGEVPDIINNFGTESTASTVSVPVDPANRPDQFIRIQSDSEVHSKNQPHIRNKTIQTVEKPYSCNTCGKGFKTKQYLSVHIRTHSGDKPYSCDSCDKCFTQSNSLKKHRRIHTRDQPYPCNLCGKKFTMQWNLQLHYRIHTGEKPHSCGICDKSFSQHNSLMGHLRIHTGDQPYKCETCGKHFTQSSNFSVHIRTHTGDQSYKCEICGKRFSQHSRLMGHLRIHTGDQSYKCEICGKRFIQSSDLKTHKKVHTGGRNPTPAKSATSASSVEESGYSTVITKRSGTLFR